MNGLRRQSLKERAEQWNRKVRKGILCGGRTANDTRRGRDVAIAFGVANYELRIMN